MPPLLTVAATRPERMAWSTHQTSRSNIVSMRTMLVNTHCANGVELRVVRGVLQGVRCIHWQSVVLHCGPKIRNNGTQYHI